ncbi:MAG: hypothetical protein JKY37_27110 [Nannocystaceae bacterium]|nr:hypothetical protein [Nannocystaceae bacterium]
MSRHLEFALLGLALVLSACVGSAPFTCENDTQCGANGAGLCTLDGWCTITDLECPSQRRYVAFAGDGLGGTCVSSASAGTGESATDSANDSDNDSGSGTTDPLATMAGSTGTSAGPGGDTEPAETAGTSEDPYGRCENGCGFEGATCLQTQDSGEVYRMCAPPCDTPAFPSTMCPTPLGDGYTVACLDTGARGGEACFIECATSGSCPNGMICALSSVCGWE